MDNRANLTPPVPALAPDTGGRLTVPIAGMHCASCTGRVERALAAVPGVSDVAVNLATGRATVSLTHPGATEAVAAAIARTGFTVPETTTTLGIDGMTCASCTGRVERGLAALPNVAGVSVNLATGRASIRHAEGLVDRAALEAAIRRLGYEPRSEAPSGTPGRAARRARQDAEAAHLRRDVSLAALLALPVVVLDMGGHLVPGFHAWLQAAFGPAGSGWIQACLATLILAGPGRRFFRQGIPALLRGHPDMNALVALGAGAAYLYSLVSVVVPGWLPAGTAHLYFEAASLIVTLILLGRMLEARAKGRTGAAIARLIDLAPKTARLVRDGVEAEVAQEALRVGDRVRVRPGERIAADGAVVEGTSYVDESMVTGESVPVAKAPGDAVTGGTLNTNGSVDLLVERIGAETVLARIVAMVEAAQGAKLPIQALVDRVTLRFVPAVMGLSALTFLGWLALGPSPALGVAIVNAIAVLIIACPCAMGLATPTAIMVGTGRAAERGVLFRSGTALQGLRDVKLVAFDKTGTLTQGRPSLTDLEPAPGIAPDAALRLAAALESRSEHPVAGAIVAAARARGLAGGVVTAVEARAGYGITGRVDDRAVAIGARRYMERLGIGVEVLAGKAAGLERAGRSPLYLAVDGRLAALIAVADPIKPGAAEAVASLRAQGLAVAMVTGDARGAAEGVARQLGIDTVSAELPPGGKVEAVRALRARFGPVAFVGDGINDAPALAEADVGLAIGTGTDIAVESAEVVLMAGDLARIVTAIHLSRAVMRTIRQNLFWAFAYNIALIPVAAGLLAPFGGPLLSPILAAGAMALSSVFVLGNALRLRRAGGGAAA